MGQDRAFPYFPPQYIKTGQDGRFRIESLLPGYEYHLSDESFGFDELFLGEGLRSGQTTDLGDVQMK